MLEDEDPEHPYYKIENNTDHITIKYVQSEQDSRDEGLVVNPKQNVPFAFVDPKKPHILTVHTPPFPFTNSIIVHYNCEQAAIW